MAEGENMKANIHPEVKDATVTCACGATFQTKSTKEKIDVEICSECHPFYTGTQGKAKKTGNIEKFNKKFGLDKEQNYLVCSFHKSVAHWATLSLIY